mmetsp:Transcript_36853/g.92368  ORF Transcript_36853/g.92368 Transcript_36853/m.92368 type:complete len:373 (+) Transcript_36853:760-1878(+)
MLCGSLCRSLSNHSLGELIAIVGKCGASKSSLLQALLGEMVHRAGEVGIAGRVAFSSQSVWLLNGTLRENISVDSEAHCRSLDQQRYERTLDVCALRPDLASLPAGDLTSIGEKGVTLSGGQKARVSLARAVYADADVYLLDDVLSAVDAHVGQSIFERCICGELRSKTRILVTHQMACLPSVDRIVILEQGRITAVGSYAELVAQGVNFTSLVPDEDPTTGQAEDEAASSATSRAEKLGVSVVDQEQVGSSVARKAVLRESVEELLRRSVPESDDDEKQSAAAASCRGDDHDEVVDEAERSALGQLIQEETHQTGAVKWDVYASYLRYCASVPILVLLVLVGRCETIWRVELVCQTVVWILPTNTRLSLRV